MNPLYASYISQVGFVRVVKPSKINVLSVMPCPRVVNIIAFIQENSPVSSGVCATFLGIYRILRVGGFAKVANSIISSIAVDVINMLAWPPPMNVEPRQSMGVVMPLSDGDCEVADLHKGARNGAYRWAPVNPLFPPENSCTGFVVQGPKQLLMGHNRDRFCANHALGLLPVRRIEIKSLLGGQTLSGLAFVPLIAAANQG